MSPSCSTPVVCLAVTAGEEYTAEDFVDGFAPCPSDDTWGFR